MKKIIFIVGPTALGKTEVSYVLARQIKAEIISCDSMLVYKEPEIITSKPPTYMLDDVKHHFVGSISASEPYSVFDYCSEAVEIVSDLFNEGKAVVVCGGSGLYLKALLDGILKGPVRDEDLRDRLIEKSKEKGVGCLYEELERIDPKTAAKIVKPKKGKGSFKRRKK